MRKTIPLAVLASLLAFACSAADLSSSGDWMQQVTAMDLPGAGSDLTPDYSSASASTVQNIANTSGATWTLKARKSDDNWNGSLTVLVRRTSDGSGSGTILGGSDYVALSSLDTVVCTGSGDRNNISLQYKLTGMSKDIVPNNYSTSVIFTVE